MERTVAFAILMYHRITGYRTSDEAKYACPSDLFAAHIRWLKGGDHTLVSLDEIETYLSGIGQMPGKPVVITLDDGYRDNYENAFPTLQEWNVSATIFVTTGAVGRMSSWTETPWPMLDWGHIREMDRVGIAFGSHCVQHVRLAEVSPEKAWDEMSGSKQDIEFRLGKSIHHFAYPFGNHSPEVRTLASEAGYRLGLSAREGVNTRKSDRFALHRIPIHGEDSIDRLSRKLCGAFGCAEQGDRDC